MKVKYFNGYVTNNIYYIIINNIKLIIRPTYSSVLILFFKKKKKYLSRNWRYKSSIVSSCYTSRQNQPVLKGFG